MHKIDRATISRYCNLLNDTGADICEIGHGMNRRIKHFYWKICFKLSRKLENCEEKFKKNKTFSTYNTRIPKIDDIKRCSDLGVDIFRIGSNSPDYNLTFQWIEYCKKINKEAWCVLMMSHLIYDKKKYLDVLKEISKIGIKQVIFMDTAGYYLPTHIEKIFKDTKRFKMNFGIHAHNNFSTAVWNSIVAVLNGANVVDVATRGLGAGAGNTHFEVFAAITKIKLQGINLDLNKIFTLSDYFKKRLQSQFNKKDNFIENNNILSGYYGVVAAFAHKLINFQKYKKDIYQSYKKVGERNLVAGQEDLIPDILSEID